MTKQFVKFAIVLISSTITLGAQPVSFPSIAIGAPGTATSVKIYYVTDRSSGLRASPNDAFTAGRSQNGVLTYGSCVVTIPSAHVLGALEEPGIFEFTQDATKHVVLQKVEASTQQTFYNEIKRRLAGADRRDAFVFIHGYNTTFRDASRRAAQLAYDLKFTGAAVVYSWPSQGKISRYLVDETNAEWTIPHLVTFLREFRSSSGASRVYLIAHSMGARILTRALKELADDRSHRVKFNQIILAAPDIDRDTFVQLSRAINVTAERITLYASSRDRAIRASKNVHGYPRAGESGGGIVVVPGVDTIDATSVTTDFLDHSYFAGRTVLQDLFFLIRYDASPASRFAVYPQSKGSAVYWQLHP